MILVQRLLGAVLGLVFLLAALLFASVALGIALAIGVAVWVVLWWRSRSLPRRRVIIEGEYRDVSQPETLEDRRGERPQ
jgi:O-antigen/teichoic acid export membrane protein